MHAGGQEAKESLEQAKVFTSGIGDFKHRTYPK